MSLPPIDLIRQRFPDAKFRNGKCITHCPAHDDKNPSLSISVKNDGTVLLKCFGGCSPEKVLASRGLMMADLFPNGKGYKWGGGVYPSKERCNPATSGITNREKMAQQLQEPTQPAAIAQPPTGCTLAQYAEAKQLPEVFLKKLGLSNIVYNGQEAVRIPYYDEKENQGPTRFRLAIQGTENGIGRFTWKRGSKPILYGLWRKSLAIENGYAVLVEGESDCHTAWYKGIPAFGVPGASNWKEERDAQHFDDIQTIYVIDEQDKGSETIHTWLESSRIKDRVLLVRFDTVKDLSDLYCDDPDRFLERWEAAKSNAIRWKQIEEAKSGEQEREAWEICKTLAQKPNILECFYKKLSESGVAGESVTAKVLYLALNSRWLDRPVSIAVKGPSSGGKSYVTERTLKFFPKESFYALSGMSERALAYSEEPIKNRFLVLYEAAGIRGEFATYLIRSLLSEGCVRYETVEKTAEGLQPRLIEREGPTGLIVTTTSLNLHPENETRLLSLNVADSPDQTRKVLEKLAEESEREPDLSEWIALQSWLDYAEHRVTIPFAGILAEKIAPVATRLRRDFTVVLNLIRSHAILHQISREQDAEGRIIATIEDYKVVRGLVADLIAEGIGTTISSTIRETVDAVHRLTYDTNEPTNKIAVARELKLDKSTANRRVAAAIKHGYIRNLESRRGTPAQLVIGEPLPENRSILPTSEELEVAVAERLQGCTSVAKGVATAIPPHSQDLARQVAGLQPDLSGICPPPPSIRVICQNEGCGGDVVIVNGRGKCNRCGLVQGYE